MSVFLIIVILVPILFVIGTTYNALKEQKRLEEGQLKDILKKRQELKNQTIDKLKNKKTNIKE